MNTTKKKLLGYVSIAVALMLAVGGFLTFSRISSQATAEAVQIDEAATVVSSPFTEAVTKVKDSVVGVNNYTSASNYGYFGFDDNSGFGNGSGGNNNGGNGNNNGGNGDNNGAQNGRQVLQSSGSGVVIAENYVLTNYHVVEGASALEVTSGDKTFEAVVAGYDDQLDLAVLKVDSLGIAPVTVGDSDVLNVGDWAICIGNPLSFTGTTTVGVISALNREVTSEAYDIYGRRDDLKNYMIQTDAAINAGNSGGGMFNVAGELIGVPSLKYTGSFYSGTSVEGIGMAIPINAAKPLITEVLSGKTGDAAAQGATGATASPAKPRMGVKVTNASDTFPYPVQQGILPNGVYVTTVESGSPADKAGIIAGDIIVEADGTVITSTSQLISILQAKNAGDSVSIKLYRSEGLASATTVDDIKDGAYQDVQVELAILDDVAQ